MAEDSVKIKIPNEIEVFKEVLSKIGGAAKASFSTVAKAVAAVAPVVAAAGEQVIKLGATFEQSAAKVSTLFGGVEVDTNNLNKKILELSNATGIAANELNEGLYSALAAGIPVTKDMEQATTFLGTSMKYAKVAQTDIETAIATTTQTLTAYGMGAEYAEHVQDVLLQTQMRGVTTANDLQSALAQVTPVAAAFNVSLEQVGAALAEMTSQQIPAADAASWLNSLLSELGKSGSTAAGNLAQAAEGSKYAGMSFKQMMDSGATLDEVLGMMNESAKSNNKTLDQLFSSVDAGKSALSLMNGEGEQFRNNLEAMNSSAGLLGDGFDTLTNTFEGSATKIQETLENLGIEIFDQSNAMLGDMAGFASDMLSQLYSAFSEGGFEGLAIAIGDILNQIVQRVAEYAPIIVEMASSFIQILIQGLTDNMEPIVAGAFQIINTLVIGILSLLPMILDLGLQLLIALAQGITEQLPTLIPTVINVLLQLCTTLVDNLPLLLNAAFDLIIGLANGLMLALPALIAQVPKIVTGIVEGLLLALPKLMECAATLLVAFGSGFTTNLPVLIPAIDNIIVAIFNMFKNIEWGKLGMDIIRGLINGIVNSSNTLIQALKDVCKNTLNTVTKFFGINSPSRLMRDAVGKPISLGMANGIEAESDAVSTSMMNMGENAFNTMKRRSFGCNFKQALQSFQVDTRNAFNGFVPQLAAASGTSATRYESIETINNHTVQTVRIVADPSNIYDVVVEEGKKRGKRI